MIVLLRMLVVFWVFLPGSYPVRADSQVDLELVLAVDISLSMDLDEQRLQRDGYVAAFRDPEIQRVIQSGGKGRIAVTYMEWAGPSAQHVVVPWMLVDSPAAAERFAAELERTQISRARMTSISAALEFAGRLLQENTFKGDRQVIDISGDGPNNSGRPIVPIRDSLVAGGVIINGLPILLKDGQSSGMFDLSNLDAYYEQCVIGGQGSFVIPIRAKSEFGTAIRRKLMLEISGLALEPRIVPAQAPGRSDGMDCMVGEMQWRRYMDGPYRN
jgi:hypothetical protein